MAIGVRLVRLCAWDSGVTHREEITPNAKDSKNRAR